MKSEWNTWIKIRPAHECFVNTEYIGWNDLEHICGHHREQNEAQISIALMKPSKSELNAIGLEMSKLKRVRNTFWLVNKLKWLRKYMLSIEWPWKWWTRNKLSYTRKMYGKPHLVNSVSLKKHFNIKYSLPSSVFQLFSGSSAPWQTLHLLNLGSSLCWCTVTKHGGL